MARGTVHVDGGRSDLRSAVVGAAHDGSDSAPDSAPDDAPDDVVARAAAWVSAARRVTVLTGAGISTESGIPDYRGPQGVWTKNPGAEKQATLQVYLSDPEVRRRAWQVRASSPMFAAEPNRGHLALVALEQQGRLHALVTQNVDGLHQRAGSSPERVVEVHGTVHFARCWECDDRRPMEELLARVRAGEADPPCAVCGGIVKSDTISFGQSLVPEVIDRAMAVSEACEVFLAVGTSLSVYPVASTVRRAHAAGARVVICNAEPTPFDGIAHAVVRGAIGEVLPRICGLDG